VFDWHIVVCLYHCVYTIIYSLTPWSTVLLENLIGFQLVKIFPAFFGTRNSSTPVTSARKRGLTLSHHDSFLRQGVVSNSPKPQAGRPPLVGRPRLLIQPIRSYAPYWRPFLHPQPEGAPWHGDRDPLTTVIKYLCLFYVYWTVHHCDSWRIRDQLDVTIY